MEDSRNDIVEVEIKDCTVWININGQCKLRAQSCKVLALTVDGAARFTRQAGADES